jgi:Ca2+-binding EF-hand superfamily protein
MEDPNRIPEGAREDAPSKNFSGEKLVQEMAHRGDEIYTDAEIKQAFIAFDTDRNGVLSQTEFKDVVTTMGDAPLSKAEFEDIFHSSDANRDEQISWQEFLDWSIEIQKATIRGCARQGFQDFDGQMDDFYDQEFESRHSF